MENETGLESFIQAIHKDIDKCIKESKEELSSGHTEESMWTMLRGFHIYIGNIIANFSDNEKELEIGLDLLKRKVKEIAVEILKLKHKLQNRAYTSETIH